MERHGKEIRVLTSYYRPKPGGFCKRLFRGINALLASGCEVHYLAIVRFPIEHARCHFHRFPWPAEKTDTLLFWAVFHLLSPLLLTYLGLRHRITHAFAFGPTYALILQPLRIVKRIPLSLFLRADTIRNHEMKEKAVWLVALERILEGIAIQGAYVYGVSSALIHGVSARHSWARPRRTGIVRNDLEVVEPVSRVPVSRPVKLGCAGILEKRKNQTVLLEAMKYVSSQDAHLYIFGLGPDEQRLKRRVNELGVRDRVTFMGWRSASEIWSSIDVLLMPSFHEGAPNTVLEALAQDVAVVASRIPEHAEILPEESLLVPEDASVWAERIHGIAAKPERELSRLRQLEHEIAEALRFDWDEVFVQHVLVLQKDR